MFKVGDKVKPNSRTSLFEDKIYTITNIYPINHPLYNSRIYINDNGVEKWHYNVCWDLVGPKKKFYK